VIRFLRIFNTTNNVIAGVRDIEKAKLVFKDSSTLKFVHFDFENPDTFENALTNINLVFLLRPPHVSDIDQFFKPLIAAIKKKNIQKIVFLSVQGAEKSKVIPHHKIERLITASRLDYIYLRPSYFMQNLTTTLISDIQSKREIILPAGKAKFNWVDTRNVGEAAALLLEHFHQYKNQAVEITGLENKSFAEVTQIINSQIKNPVRFRNINPLTFYRIQKREGMVTGMIIAMILLHFLPRFQQEPRISHFYEGLTKKKPTNLKMFIEREKKVFEQQRKK
jgi:uncharacterized protein YbjT (DUF2867 family)